MSEMRKITAFVPVDLLKGSQEITGEGVSETLRRALQEMNHAWACRELLKLKGSVDLEADGVTLADLREDKDYDWTGLGS